MKLTVYSRDVFADEEEMGANWKSDGEEWFWACDLDTGILYHVAMSSLGDVDVEIVNVVKRSLPGK